MDRPGNEFARPPGFDWQGFGYLTSIVSVFLLGAIAWPKPGDPGWHLPLLIAGMTTSVLGMAFRYLAHLKQARQVKDAKDSKARARSP
ncbi:MAG TPA: hypothetical protein VFP57_07170 [Sphingomicrobium sp.]|jgi:hypothetical protein|nr:hypothetical protein [Sphingomicrobium sp.]